MCQCYGFSFECTFVCCDEYCFVRNAISLSWATVQIWFQLMVKCWIYHNYLWTRFVLSNEQSGSSSSSHRRRAKNKYQLAKIEISTQEISPISNRHIDRTKMETTLVAILWISRKTGLSFIHIWQHVLKFFFLYFFLSFCFLLLLPLFRVFARNFFESFFNLSC